MRYVDHTSATESINPNLNSISISNRSVDDSTHINSNDITVPLAENQGSVYVYDSCAYIAGHTNYTTAKTSELDNVPK